MWLLKLGPGEGFIIPSGAFFFSPPPTCRWVKSWSLKLRLDTLLDYCLKLQSPCDDSLALDPTLTCFPVILDTVLGYSGGCWLQTVSVFMYTCVRMDLSAGLNASVKVQLK